MIPFFLIAFGVVADVRAASGTHRAHLTSVALPKAFRSNIRVAVKPSARSCTFYSIGQLAVTADQDSGGTSWKGTIYTFFRGDTLVLQNGWGQEHTAMDSMVLSSANRYNFIEVDNLEYRGKQAVIVHRERNTFTVVNELSIDDYLKGVLPFEIGHHGRDKLEALKAQAVAARTYTFKRLALVEAGRAFDVYTDVRDQVYKGRSGEYLLADRAIRETQGVVALYGDSLIECYYSSTCGGKTSDIGEVWPDRSSGKPYLVSVEDEDEKGIHCTASKYITWQQAWSFEQMDRMVKKFLPAILPGATDVGRLKKLKVKERTVSGRIKKLQVVTEKGKWTVRGDRVRWLLRRPEKDFPILYSAWFDISRKPKIGRIKTFVATGRGWGHGVGMCQIGTLGMAAKGYPFDQILTHFYQGIRLVRWKY